MIFVFDFASAMSMRSGNIVNSGPALFRSKLGNALKHRYIDSRSAWEVSGGKTFKWCSDI